MILQQNAELKDSSFFNSFWAEKLWYLVTRHKKVFVYPHNFSVSIVHIKPVCSIILRGHIYFLCMVAIPGPKHPGLPLGGNLQPGHILPCILPSSTSLDLIPSYMGVFHLFQMLLHRPSFSTRIYRFHRCDQPFFPSI